MNGTKFRLVPKVDDGRLLPENGTHVTLQPVHTHGNGDCVVQDDVNVKEDDGGTNPLENDPRRKEVSVISALVFVLTPILACPLIFCVDETHSKQARCGYVVLVMAVYWITEVVPLAITALLPAVLFPMLGIMSAKEASGAYMNDTCMLSLGALTVAVAFEVWDVHKRLALFVIRHVGSEPKRLLLGVSLVTWALAIFISNTATTAMMLITATSLLDMYKDVLSLKNRGNSSHDELGVKFSDDEFITKFSKAMCLTVAYSSSIGGTGSAIGAGPCMIFFATATELFESKGLKMPITFAGWLAFGVPLSFLVALAQWAWLVVRFLRCKGGLSACCGPHAHEESSKMAVLIDAEYRKLGPVSYAQKSILVIFFLLILGWLTRDIGGAGGWGSFFPPKTVTDSTPAVFFAVLMFALPSISPMTIMRREKGFRRYRPLLQWQDVKEKMAWSLYLLLGGGVVLAKGCSTSGLSTLLGDHLFVLKGLNKWLILFLLCCMTTMTTEIMSNTATGTLLMPVLQQMSLSMGTNPLFYMYPASLSAVYAFMLPAATPPNAVVFSKGLLRSVDMLTTGAVVNLLAIPLLIFATATWGTAMFDLDTIPPEFIHNSTGT